jgi:hypothetical protein
MTINKTVQREADKFHALLVYSILSLSSFSTLSLTSIVVDGPYSGTGITAQGQGGHSGSGAGIEQKSQSISGSCWHCGSSGYWSQSTDGAGIHPGLLG